MISEGTSAGISAGVSCAAFHQAGFGELWPPSATGIAFSLASPRPKEGDRCGSREPTAKKIPSGKEKSVKSPFFPPPGQVCRESEMKAQVCCLKYFRIFYLEEGTIYLYNNSGRYCGLIGFQVRFRSKTGNSTGICPAALRKGGSQSTLMSFSGAAADWHGEGEDAAINTQVLWKDR